MENAVIGDVVKSGDDLGIVTFSYNDGSTTVYFPSKKKEAVLKTVDLVLIEYSAGRKHFGESY